MDVQAYLQSKGVVVKPAGASNIHVPCFYCGEDPSKRGRLYINTGSGDEQGLHFCHLCGTRGNLRSIMKHFGDEIAPQGDDSEQSYLVIRAAAKFYHSNLHPDVRKWLEVERGLKPETIDGHQFGWAPSEDPSALYRHLRSEGFKTVDILNTGLVVERSGKCRDFLVGVVTIPYHVAGNAVLIRGKDMQGKYVTPPGQKTRLFNVDCLLSSEEVAVAEGEIDALSMEQLGYNAVACPGATTWQDSWDDYFTETKLVFLCFDNDGPGVAGAKKVQARLGHKAKLVSIPLAGLPAGENDVNNWVAKLGATRSDFDKLFSDALKSQSLLLTVDDAFEEWSAVQGLPGIKFGYELLDIALRPGLLPGQVLIILAKTNTGKTLALFNIFQRAAMVNADLKILFISLEQTRGDWFERARRIWNFYNLDCPTGEVHQKTLDFWRHRLVMTDRNRISEEELISCIHEYELHAGARPDLVAVDYLGYWAAGFKERDRYAKVTEAIMSLKAVAKDERVALIAPHQVNRMADFGMELEIDQARDSVVGSTLIQLSDGSRVPIKDLVDQTPSLMSLGSDMNFHVRDAQRVWKKGVRDTYSVELSSGRSLICTAGHPLLTTSGWKPLRDLVVGDQVAAARNIETKRLANEDWNDLFFEEIISVLPDGREAVYDIAMTGGDHNFIANEIVVHNSGAVEETADFVFGLWAPDSMKGVAAEDRTGVVNLRIGKSRHGGKGNDIKLQFAPLTLTMVPAEDPTLVRLAKDELEYSLRRETWQHAIFRHASGLKNDKLDHIDRLMSQD